MDFATADVRREDRLDEILAAYLRDLDAGRAPDQAALLALHPDLSAELHEFFTEQDRLRALAEPLRRVTRAARVPGPEAEVPETAPVGPEGLPPLPAQSFGDYELLGELARGGMGVVFKARQTRLNRPVALKLLRSGPLASAEVLQRFRNEAEAVAGLDHPNIVPIYDVGEVDGAPYFSMKLMEGGSLSARPARFRYDPKGAVRLVVAVARAVHYAHQRGILHRDLKPSNVLLDADGRPYVTDFGLLRRVGGTGGADLTRSGDIVGTPGYMAPEQAAGRRAAITTATDVYGLGALLYALLTGAAPFEGEDVIDTLVRVGAEAPEPPARRNPAVEPDLSLICLKCLEKEPARRYPDAAAVADELERYLEGRSLRQTRPVSRGERLWRWCRRNRAIASLLAALFAALAVGFAGTAWKWREAVLRTQEAEDNGRAAVENASAEQAARLRAESLLDELGREHLHQAVAHLEQGKTTLGMLELGRALEIAPAGTGDLRRLVTGNLSGWRRKLPPPIKAVLGGRPAGGGANASRGADLPVRAAAFSPDGRTVVTGGDDGVVRMWDVADGLPVGPPLELPGSVRGVLFSPDGKAVLTSGMFLTPRLWDASGGQLLRQFVGHKADAWAAAFRPDGKAVLTGGADGTARLWDVATGQPLIPPLEHPDWVWAVNFSPDGLAAVTGCKDRAARVWDLRTGKAIGRPLPHPDEVTAVGFSADGRDAWTGCRDGAVRLWDLARGEQRGAALKQGGPLRAIDLVRSARQFHTGGRDGAARPPDAAPGASPGAPPPAEEGEQWAAALSPDGKLLVTAGTGDARVREVPAGADADVLPCGHWVSAVAFSPDGKTLLTGSAVLPVPLPGLWPGGAGEVRLWDAATRQPLGPALPFGHMLLSAAFHPDGSRFLTGDGVLFGSAGGFRLWDSAASAPLGEAVDAGASVYAVAFDPSGRTFVVGTGRGEGDLARKALALIGRAGMAGAGLDNRLGNPTGPGRAVIYDAATRRVVHTVDQPAWVTAAAFSPDGKTLLTGGADGLARRWDVATGRPAGRDVSAGDSVIGVAYGRDGRTFLTGSGGGVTKLWDADTGEFTGRAFAQRGWVRAVAVSPDGALVLTAGAEKAARLWDAKTGEPIGPPLEHQDSVMAAAFSPDGRLIVTGSCDKTARLWKTPVLSDADAERVLLWLQVWTGADLSREGVLRRLDAATWRERRQRLRELGGPPAL